MLLNIKSYNGTTLNDTNFSAWFPFGEPMMPGAKANFAARARTFSFYASKELKNAKLSFHVLCKGTFHSQYETLKALFRVDDFTPRALVVEDAADSNRQWYVMGTAVEPLEPAGNGTVGEYVVTLALVEPLWRSVVVESETLSVSASGDDIALTVLGNMPARPKFTLTIGASKAGGFQYRKFLPWYNPLAVENGEPLELTNGGWNTAALIADTSKSNQINQTGGIDAVTLSIPVDTAVGGGLSAAGGLCYVDTEQILYTNISAGVMTVAANGRGYGGTTAAVHLDNAVLKRSQMMANGQDVRVQFNQNFVDIWTSGMNTSATKIWCVPKYQADFKMTLLTALGTGSVSAIAVEKTTANLAVLKRMPASGLLLIENEVFYYAGVNITTYVITVVGRAQRGTSAATHAAKVAVRMIEHDVWLLWGNASIDAQIVNDARKPMINLATSTNTTWVWESFGTASGTRSATWRPTLVKSAGQTSATPTRLYTDTQNADADPFAVVGISARAFQSAGVWKAETYEANWLVSHPAGFATVTVSGYKRRTSTTWSVLTFVKSTNGTTMTVVFTEATPTVANAWQALAAHSGVSLSTGVWTTIGIKGSGSVTAVANHEHDFELTDASATITSASVMQLGFASTTEDNYYLDAAISVTETGESLQVIGTCKVGDEIVIDCDAETIKVNGIEGGIALDWNSVREGWLDLPSPQQKSTCTVVYTESGVSNAALDIDWENRNTL